MPSGAKRRKAAKKKKEQQQSNNNNDNPQGNDDPKSQDERDSDGGELGSPVSQEHSLNEENKPAGEVSSNTGGSQQEDVSVGKRDIEIKDVSAKHDKGSKSSSSSSKSSSGSSSSDDESQVTDKKLKEEANISASSAATLGNVDKVVPQEATLGSAFEKPVEKANGSSVVETFPSNDSDEPQAPMSMVAKFVTEGARVQNPEVVDVIESGSTAIVDKYEVLSGLAEEKNENRAIPILDENAGVATSAVGSDVNGNENKISSIQGSETAISAEKSKDYADSAGTVPGNEGKIPTSSVVHTSEASDDAFKARDSERSEHTETQPLVSSAPRVTQRTSWLNCCGLCDLLTGSD